MAAKYNMSEKCIDILYYGKAELLQVYLLKHISICLIIAQCGGEKGYCETNFSVLLYFKSSVKGSYFLFSLV